MRKPPEKDGGQKQQHQIFQVFTQSASRPWRTPVRYFEPAQSLTARDGQPQDMV
jgi:hypothetical protein